MTRTKLVLIHKDTENEVKRGDTIKNWRGDDCIFDSVVSSTGKIYAKASFSFFQELFPTVFPDYEIVERER
jgi:hypothetical protein